MKFSLASLSCARFILSARPELVSHQLDVNESTWDHCTGHPAADDARNRCKQPGHYIYDELLCADCRWGCLKTRWSKHDKCHTHPSCKIECCDTNNRQTPHSKCECTPRGEKYVIDEHNHHVIGKNTAEKCCGRDNGGLPTIDHNNHQLCGCGEADTEIHYGGHGDRDCCSGRADANNWCIRRDCAKKNQAGHCCRTSNDYTHPWHIPYDNKCGCFHVGAIPNRNDNVDFTNCCSGREGPTGSGCGCIEDENADVPHGAEPADCCSGKFTDDNKHCKAPTCVEVGGTLDTNGAYCCSGKTVDGDAKKCACLAPGEKLGEEAHPRDCCSGKAEDGVCVFLFKGDPAPNGTGVDLKQVCNSGKVDGDGKCRCVPKGGTSDNETDCCSGAYLNPEKHDNMCGCVAVGKSLEYGAKANACCTKDAVDGVCICAAPGEPVLPMMKPSMDCCAKDAKDGSTFCGCVGPNAAHNVTWEDAEFCCGGSRNYNGQGCDCVLDDVAVGGWAHPEACCSGKIVERDGAHVCDKSP